MVTREDRVRVWPRTKSGRPVFKTTNDAVFFAQLIFDDEREITELNFYHGKLREKIKDLREREEPNLDNLMSLAVQSQLYRECIEEVMRIIEDPFTARPNL